MFKHVFMGLALLFVLGNGMAYGQQLQNDSGFVVDQDKCTAITEVLNKIVILNQEQYAQVESLNCKTTALMNSIRAKYGNDEKVLKKEVFQIDSYRERRLKRLLNDTQWQKYEAFKKNGKTLRKLKKVERHYLLYSTGQVAFFPESEAGEYRNTQEIEVLIDKYTRDLSNAGFSLKELEEIHSIWLNF